MFAEVLPKCSSQEGTLFRAALEVYGTLAGPKGLVFEFLPGCGIKVSAGPGTGLSEGYERLLVSTGVLILKHANVPGSVEIVRRGDRSLRTKEETSDGKAEKT